MADPVDLPYDVRAALVESAKDWLLNNYAGGMKKLEAWSDHYASLTKVYSFGLPGTSSKNLRRLARLAKDGVLIKAPRDGKNGTRILVPCWGSRDKVPRELRPRFDDVLTMLHATGKPVLHFGTTKSGDPKHPLMLAYSTPLTPWTSQESK